MYTCYIYKIYNTENDNIYIGSTKQSINARFRNHKHATRQGSSRKIHNQMRDLGVDKFHVVEIDRQEVEDRQSQLKLETEWVERFQSELNIRRPYTSDVKKLEIARTYKQNHKAQIKEYNKKFWQDHRETEIERTIKWREDNADKVKNYSKKYGKEHREFLKEKAKKNRQKTLEDGSFRCEACERNFCQSSALKKHLIRKH